MTPTLLTRPTSIAPAQADNTPELETQPLKFTTERQCTNTLVMAAVIDALAEQSRTDQTIATILKNAWLNNYQTELNQLIENIDKLHGSGTVVINRNVVRILGEAGITLTTNNNGTVHLARTVAAVADPDRHTTIHQSLTTILPKGLSDLIGTYDDEIEISEKNETEILAILKSGHLQAKVNVIAAASRQDQISCLNQIFQTFKSQHGQLNLSRADLSFLDLRGINLESANLSHAILAGSDLSGANLTQACLRCSNLSDANLTDAILVNANLSKANLFQARLVGAQLKFADLSGSKLNGIDCTAAVLDFVNLKRAELYRAVLVNASLIHANMDGASLIRANLSNAKLLYAKLIHANLSDVNLTGADLSDASFEHVTLRGNPNLSATIWDGVRARKIDTDWQGQRQLPNRFWRQCV